MKHHYKIRYGVKSLVVLKPKHNLDGAAIYFSSTAMQGRIIFHESPWPKGHNIVDFEFSARIKDSGLWFDLHLRSEYYTANDKTKINLEKEKSIDSIWQKKSAWANSHQCTISSTHWADRPGFLVATPNKKIDFNKLPKTFNVDPVKTYTADKAAMHIYLLGHDAIAGHRIRFTRQGDVFDLDWQGKISLADSEKPNFKYTFSAQIKEIDFGGIFIAGEDKIAAVKEARKYIKDIDAMRIQRHSQGMFIIDL